MYLALLHQHLFKTKHLSRVDNQAWPMCTMEEHSAIKRNKLPYLQHHGSQNSTTSERNQVQEHVLFESLYIGLKRAKLIYGGSNQNSGYLGYKGTDGKGQAEYRNFLG